MNNEFLEWLKKKYASDEIGKIKAVQGHGHDYLAMMLDFSCPGVMRVDMTSYVKLMIEEFPAKLKGIGKFPWNSKLFTVDPTSRKLDIESARISTPLL